MPFASVSSEELGADIVRLAKRIDSCIYGTDDAGEYEAMLETGRHAIALIEIRVAELVRRAEKEA